MPAQAWERHTSGTVTRTNQNSKFETEWIVRDASSELEAVEAVNARAPLGVQVAGDLIVRQETQVRPLGAGLYEATVSYGPESDPESRKDFEPLENRISFDTTGGTAKITRAEKEVSRHATYSMSQQPPDLKGAIGFDGRRVNGVDIVIPKMEFQVVVYYAPATVSNMQWWKNLAAATGKVNSDAWLSFQPGEVLFMGGRGDVPLPTVAGQRIKPVAVTMSFSAMANRDDITIGISSPITKQGWDYLWVRYERMEQGGLDFPVPVHAYVDQVYPRLAYKSFFLFG